MCKFLELKWHTRQEWHTQIPCLNTEGNLRVQWKPHFNLQSCCRVSRMFVYTLQALRVSRRNNIWEYYCLGACIVQSICWQRGHNTRLCIGKLHSVNQPSTRYCPLCWYRHNKFTICKVNGSKFICFSEDEAYWSVCLVSVELRVNGLGPADGNFMSFSAVSRVYPWGLPLRESWQP